MTSVGPIHNEQGERIAFDFTAASEQAIGKAPLVVIGHGLTSDKDRPWSRALSDALAAEGVASIRIAFSGNGESEGRFEDSTITKEVGDLRAVMKQLQSDLPYAPIAYIGQSMGGAVGLLHAVRSDDLRALVSLAPLTHTAEFAERMFGNLEYGDVMLEKPHCRWNPALAEDLRRIESVLSAAAQVAVPWRIVHGTADDVTPIDFSRELVTAAPPGTDLVELEGVDHSFSGVGIEQLVEAVVPWLVPRLQE